MTREELLREEIERYEKRIATYQAMVAEWRSELGERSSVHQGEPGMRGQDGSLGNGKNSGATGDPLSRISGMIFFNKSQTEAARLFLEMVGYPLKTATIMEGLEKGGVKLGGKTPAAKKQNFYTILYRSGDVGLAAKDTWGLTTWPGISKRSSDDAEEESEQITTEKMATEKKAL